MVPTLGPKLLLNMWHHAAQCITGCARIHTSAKLCTIRQFFGQICTILEAVATFPSQALPVQESHVVHTHVVKRDGHIRSSPPQPKRSVVENESCNFVLLSEHKLWVAPCCNSIQSTFLKLSFISLRILESYVKSYVHRFLRQSNGTSGGTTIVGMFTLECEPCGTSLPTLQFHRLGTPMDSYFGSGAVLETVLVQCPVLSL